MFIPYNNCASNIISNVFYLDYAYSPYGNLPHPLIQQEPNPPVPQSVEEFLPLLRDTEFDRFASSSCKEFCLIHHITFAWSELSSEAKFWWYRRAMGLV